MWKCWNAILTALHFKLETKPHHVNKPHIKVGGKNVGVLSLSIEPFHKKGIFPNQTTHSSAYNLRFLLMAANWLPRCKQWLPHICILYTRKMQSSLYPDFVTRKKTINKTVQPTLNFFFHLMQEKYLKNTHLRYTCHSTFFNFSLQLRSKSIQWDFWLNFLWFTIFLLSFFLLLVHDFVGSPLMTYSLDSFLFVFFLLLRSKHLQFRNRTTHIQYNTCRNSALSGGIKRKLSEWKKRQKGEENLRCTYVVNWIVEWYFRGMYFVVQPNLYVRRAFS